MSDFVRDLRFPIILISLPQAKSVIFNPEEKRGKIVFVRIVVYLFLSIRMRIKPTATIATSMPIETGRK